MCFFLPVFLLYVAKAYLTCHCNLYFVCMCVCVRVCVRCETTYDKTSGLIEDVNPVLQMSQRGHQAERVCV